MPWTEEDQARLKELVALKLSSYQIAAAMGKSRSAVKSRVRRTLLRIARPEERPKGVGGRIGIRPFTPRCAELMRRAGVKI